KLRASWVKRLIPLALADAPGECVRKTDSCRRRSTSGARGRTRTGTTSRPRDFKSLVSTDFTTRAWLRSVTTRRARCARRRSRRRLHALRLDRDVRLTPTVSSGGYRKEVPRIGRFPAREPLHAPKVP